MGDDSGGSVNSSNDNNQPDVDNDRANPNAIDEPSTNMSDDVETVNSVNSVLTPSPVANNDATLITNHTDATINEELETIDLRTEPPAQPAFDGGREAKKSHFRPEIIFPPFIRRKLGASARAVSMLSLLLIVVLVGGGVYIKFYVKKAAPVSVIKSSFKLSVVPFKLISTVPANKSTNVNTATDIILNFNQPVTPNKLINNMFITPNTTGVYTQGKNADQVIFKPNVAFTQGSKISVMINGTYQSLRGTQLGSVYQYGFTTALPGNAVEFQDQTGLIDQVSSLPSGAKASYSVLFGNNVSTSVNVTLYKGSVNAMLESLVYPSINDFAVSTNNLVKLSTQSNIANNQTYNVQEPDGLYLAVATNSSNQQLGMVWIDFSNFGVLLRQDDQKIVLDAQSFANSQDVPANVSFYNLNSHVSLLKQSSVNGLTSINFPFSPSVDLAVATNGSETAVVPINVINSGGDIRVDQNLTTAQQAYAITDKPTYSIGNTINYAGFVRNDNDAQYVNPKSGIVNLYVSQYKGGTPLASFSANIDANGMFSGSIVPNSSWLPSGSGYAQYQIFLAAVDGNSNNDIPLSSFTLTNQANSSDNISVSFSQPSYLPNNKIVATINGVNSTGQPLANQQINLHISSEDYYENQPAANLENFGYTGNQLPSSPVSVTLNAQGYATYTINPAILPNDGNSQRVSIEANIPGQTGVGAAGGATTIVHQGNGVLSFGLTRQTIPPGANLISDVYANSLTNQPLASATINYQLVNSNNLAVLSSGSVVTNSSGFSEINIPASQLTSTNGNSMILKVSTTDQYGNTIQAQQYYSPEYPGSENYDTSGASLLDLNVSGSSGNVQVNQVVKLNISSPANIRALISFDRGRIYSPSMLNLTPGNNTFSFTVTAAMAPSFTLTFNYFLNGVYHSEGVSFNVSESTMAASVNISQPTQPIAANAPATFTINTTDNNGNPLLTNLIIDVVSSNAYDLSSKVNPNIFNVLFDPRPIMTSSSSSLSPIGSGGSRCGGGGGNIPSFADANGTVLYWQPELSTNANGQASFTINPPAGDWTISVYAMSGSTQVGSSQTSFIAQ